MVCMLASRKRPFKQQPFGQINEFMLPSVKTSEATLSKAYQPFVGLNKLVTWQKGGPHV